MCTTQMETRGVLMWRQREPCRLQRTRPKLASIHTGSSHRPNVSRRCSSGALQQQHRQQQAMIWHDTPPADRAGLTNVNTDGVQHRLRLSQHPQQQQTQPAAHTTTSDNGSSSSSSGSSSSRHLPLHALQRLLQCRPASEQPALLTAAIKATCSWEQAAALYSQHSHAFNHIHTAALISHLPKVLKAQLHPHQQQRTLHRQDQADLQLLFQDLAQLAEEILPHCSGRELANIAHGFAALGFRSRRLMQLLLGRCHLGSLKPQELANLTWAVAKLNHEMHEGWTAEVLALSKQYMPQSPKPCGDQAQHKYTQNPISRDVGVRYDSMYSSLQNPNWQEYTGFRVQRSHQRSQQPGFSHPDTFKPQELVNVAWALAAMQRHCLLSSAPPLRYSCTRVDDSWVAAYCAAAAALLADYQPADLAMGLWAVAVLGAAAVQQQWVEGQMQRAVDLVGNMQGRHIATLLWSVSQIQRHRQGRQQQQKQQRSVVLDSGTAVTSNTNSSSSRSVQEFAYACFPRLLQLLPPEQQQQQQHLQVVCVVLSSCAHLQVPPPAAAMHIMLQAAAVKLQQQSRSSWCSMQQQQQQQQECTDTTGSSSSMMLQQQQSAVHFHDASSLLYALARLQYRPSQWFLAAVVHAAATACWQQLLAAKNNKQQQQWGQQQQQQCYQALAVQPKEVAVLLWSMGKLYCQPPPRLLKLLYKVTAARISSCSSHDVGMMFWGLARMRARPRHAWLQQMVGQFLLRLDDGIVTAADVCNVVHALPLMPGGRNLNVKLRQNLVATGQLQQLAAVAQQRLNVCGPCELVQLVQGFARLGFRPDCGWISQHEACCAEIGEAQFTVRELQAIAAAKAVLATLPEQQQKQQQQPSRLMQQHLLQHQQRVQQLAAV